MMQLFFPLGLYKLFLQDVLEVLSQVCVDICALVLAYSSYL